MFVVEGHTGYCNALRRTLASELRTWAPCRVEFRENRSCHNDEYLAHRIGMIPFRRVGNGDTMELQQTGPGLVDADALTGPAFEAAHPTIPLVALRAGQTIDATVHFDQQLASKHARYAPCAGLAMRRVGPTSHELSFETVDGRDPTVLVREALDAMDATLADALQQLAHQPSAPPKSYA